MSGTVIDGHKEDSSAAGFKHDISTLKVEIVSEQDELIGTT